MNWLNYREIKKWGNRWSVSFKFTDSDEFDCSGPHPVDEFVGYAKNLTEAEEMAREWLIDQAEMILYRLNAWPDLKRAPCPHCGIMSEWDRIMINEDRSTIRDDGDSATWRFCKETAPHFDHELDYWRNPLNHFEGVYDNDTWLFECRECGLHVQ